MRILIKNGYVLDPGAKREGKFDLLVDNGHILKVSEDLSEMTDNETVIMDVKGKYVMPGFVDLHVHLREPGMEYKETVKTGTQAAAKGGYTSIFAMPNTDPVIDSPEMAQTLQKIIDQDASVHVYPVGAITLGQNGTEIVDIPKMKKAGMKALSEDGKSVMNPAIYRKAMRISREEGLPIFAHCEDKELVEGGVMNAGQAARKLGMKGISNSVEDVITARDIFLAKETGARLHLCHCSTADSVELVSMAKEQDLPVTAEVCPHHFTLVDEDIIMDDANFKMNPPLRSAEDVRALKEGLRDGTMGVISTDHAPHSVEEKKGSMANAPFGIVGLETAFSLSVTELVEGGYLTPMQLVERMSWTPSLVGNINAGSLEEGKPADIVIVDMDGWYVIDIDKFVSKGKNSPFHGKKVKGRVLKTFVSGKLIYDGEIY